MMPFIPLCKKLYVKDVYIHMAKALRVLSLFDGIACGRVALDRAGISVSEYHAFEIDKYAIQIAQKNYPDIVQHGDVFEGDFREFKNFDLLLGGSPCTYWSIAKRGRETTSDGMGFKLFMEYVRALRESECKYFLYENNYSIHQNIKDEISKHLGVQPIMINSALVSAQNRKRCYWTNIPNVTQPDDLGIMLADVLETELNTPIPINTYNDEGEKSRTVMAGYYKYGEATLIKNKGFKGGATAVALPIGAAQRGRYVDDTLVCSPVRIGTVFHGGNTTYDSKQWRVYSVQGKSVTLCGQGGGGGAKTGLYKIDLPDGDYIIRKLTPIEAERLQTLPDNYTEGISNTQRYKCIGNGWTVNVISYILEKLHTSDF